MNDSQPNQSSSARERLESEAGHLGWPELVPHFARGVVITVDRRLDLIDVALCFANDDSAQLKIWLDEALVARASDEDAKDWTTRDADFFCVVTAPWVLVQAC